MDRIDRALAEIGNVVGPRGVIADPGDQEDGDEARVAVRLPARGSPA